MNPSISLTLIIMPSRILKMKKLRGIVTKIKSIIILKILKK